MGGNEIVKNIPPHL